MWELVFGAAFDVIVHITFAVILLSVMTSTIVGIIVKIKHLSSQVIELVNILSILFQTIWIAILGLRLGGMGGVNFLINLWGNAEGPYFIGFCIGAPLGLAVGGMIGVVIGRICVRISIAIVDWIVDTS